MVKIYFSKFFSKTSYKLSIIFILQKKVIFYFLYYKLNTDSLEYSCTHFLLVCKAQNPHIYYKIDDV